MRRARDLEERLIEWGKEYGGGRYEDIGDVASWLGKMVKWGGKTPSGLNAIPLHTAADEVQTAVTALERQPGGELPSLVIRAEYLTPGQPIEMKLQRLKSVGKRVQKIRYYQHLRIARIHVAAWLKLPYAEWPDEAA